VVENFENTPEVESALAMMVECYDQLELEELKQDTLKVLRSNFPNNELVNN